MHIMDGVQYYYDLSNTLCHALLSPKILVDQILVQDNVQYFVYNFSTLQCVSQKSCSKLQVFSKFCQHLYSHNSVQ